jgi:hypothetical protein
MPNPPNHDQTPRTVEQASLRKLQLEIEALEREKRFEGEAREEKRGKLYYETQSLRWQTSLLYRLTQFATVITIFATAFGVYQAYLKLVEDKLKESQQNEKARMERVNNQYRSDLQQLLKYPVDKEQTVPLSVFLMHDITDLIDTGFKDNQDAQKQMRREVGLLVAQLVKSPEFNLTETRNTDFERKALGHCKVYEQYLIEHPMDNRDILSKYKNVLLALHNTNPNYYEKFEVNPEDPTAFIESQVSKDQTRFFQYAYLFHAYRAHVNLLESTYNAPRDPKEDVNSYNDKRAQVVDYKHLSFCWFWGATHNPSLTKSIFGGTDEQIKSRSRLCEPSKKQTSAKWQIRLATIKRSTSLLNSRR